MAVHGTLAVVVSFTLTSLSTIVVALRFYARYFLVGKLGSPDWMILISLICTWGGTVVNFYQVHFLDYSHVHDYNSFAEVAVGSLLTMWIYRLVYILSLCLIKTSILLFYIYIASSHKSFHRIVRSMMAIIILASIAMLLASIFICHPVSDSWSFEVFWNSFKGIYATQCFNPTNLWLFNAGFNLTTDVFIWLMPIPFFLNLQTMPLKRRLELVAIFSIGIIAIVASAVRLWVMVRWLSSWADNGENTSNILIWGSVEQHAGIVSASIPFLRPLVRKAMKRRRRREQPSPSPAAKLIPQQITPAQVRTPIIPSPESTMEEVSREFRAPLSPLSPISPLRPEMVMRSTL